GRFPYAFEKAAFSLKPGEISEIVESPQGYHILKGGDRRPARGTVFVEHIMKMVPPTATAEQQAAAKASIDSIYNAVSADPSKFEDLARELSDDKGSGRQGGKLSWFGAGMMVEPFDSASFALQINEISRPVKSQYGWHVIRKLDAKGPATLEEMKPMLLKRIGNAQDDRYSLVEKNLIEKLAKKHKGILNQKNIDALCSDVVVNGLDSAWYAGALDVSGTGALEIAKIGKRNISLAEWAASVRPVVIPDGDVAASELRRYISQYFENQLKSTEYDWLYANEPDYKNLLNEYREGSLLYEASLREVWDKASKDNDGLNSYFNAHRADYTWTKPHVKGILVQAINDSVADAVRTALKDVSDDNSLKAVRKQFTGKASMERILMEEGQNAMIDNLMFGGDPVKPNNK
ncbi:MAG: peptidylprolyl isomerase, partial [Muribaculaceae bacterium]|nr:peptidylprolyl isomerase [Muribaculaceae bacterium]